MYIPVLSTLKEVFVYVEKAKRQANIRLNMFNTASLILQKQIFLVESDMHFDASFQNVARSYFACCRHI